MNMMTSKPQYGHIPLSEALKLADGDIEVVRNARLIARNGKPYISRRLLEIRLAEKRKEQESVERNEGSDGRGSASVCEGRGGPEEVGSLKQALKRLFSRLFGSKPRS
jgi:hypothetical protein